MQDTIYHREISEFFQFFSEWFDGSCPNTDEQFTRIISVMPEDSTYIDHEGELIEAYPFFRDTIRWSHGSISKLHMWAENIQLHWEIGDLALVTFHEWSRASVVVPGGRLCTVIFRKNSDSSNGIEWLHVHETLLPATE